MLTKSHIQFPFYVDFRLFFGKLHKKPFNAIPYDAKNIEQAGAMAALPWRARVDCWELATGGVVPRRVHGRVAVAEEFAAKSCGTRSQGSAAMPPEPPAHFAATEPPTQKDRPDELTPESWTVH
ncbi:hypothetical protein [Mesorhizobium sp. B2-3-4]|uniref:hypothetical protein n=1 Tax=Mesorhizobium sp. B2-3-4 TaxID=2589959 RepID=UPI00112AF4BA|nr:hypothetical protein [Mesorhizobium sp. B2-3-4]TPM24878.1 hypothetical protein FJ967_33145 [Mesorhizobium sp. B2-3-4]